MVITIYSGFDRKSIILSSKRDEFTKEWGRFIKVSPCYILKTLEKLSYWANNELDEECLFEVE